MYTAHINNNTYQIEFESNTLQKGRLNGEPFELDLIKDSETEFHLIKANNSYSVEVVSVNHDSKEVVLKLNGIIQHLTLKDEIDELLKNMGLGKSIKHDDKEIKAPMPGMVGKILVKAGDSVKKGDILLVLEAMKMENNIKSPVGGTIQAIICKVGKAVEKSEILLVFA
jgi:biotin carboxyl carrier protein